MKPIMAAAIAAAPAAATKTATEPEPKKWSKCSREGVMIRTIKVDFDQSAELSKLVSHRMNQQRWAFNMAVREKLNDPRVTEFDLNKMLTGWRRGKEWTDGGVFAQRAGLCLGLDAVKKFMVSNGKKRANKSLWKYLARRDREKEGILDIDTAVNLPSNKWSNKKNKWRLRNSLFSRKGKQRSLSVFRNPVYKGNSMLHLPGIGTVRVHGDVEYMDMRSFQLVETTEKTTRRTESHNRTYRLHIQIEIKAPEPSESAVVRGVDMGIVHEATTVDLDTGRHKSHDIPDGCRRTNGDDISKMCSDLSRKRGGRGNRRIRQDANEGADGGSKSTNSNNTSGHNRNKAMNPKSRGYKELQRKIRKKRERLANRQTNWERHASKDIANGVGTGHGRPQPKQHDSQKKRPGKPGEKVAQPRDGILKSGHVPAADRTGVRERRRHRHNGRPQGHQHTCGACGCKDKESRIFQGRFRCTNDNCDNDINADINAAHNIASKATAMAAGRRGSSSKGARLRRGIAPARSVNKTQEPSVGGIARAPPKGRGTAYSCI